MFSQVRRLTGGKLERTDSMLMAERRGSANRSRVRPSAAFSSVDENEGNDEDGGRRKSSVESLRRMSSAESLRRASGVSRTSITMEEV